MISMNLLTTKLAYVTRAENVKLKLFCTCMLVKLSSPGYQAQKRNSNLGTRRLNKIPSAALLGIDLMPDKRSES